MKGIEFDEQNLILKGDSSKGVYDLNACRATDPETGLPHIVAKFEMSEEELEIVKETGGVWVSIMGQSWPPLMPTAHSPFSEIIGFQPNVIGLPVMKYREEVEEMLKKLYYDEDWMDEKWWNEFLYYMSKRFHFVEFGEKLERGVENGHSVEDQLKDVEKVMLKIMTTDQLKNLGQN